MGRPRDAGVERVALDAAARVLAEHGHQALTVDAVAARTGIAKTTLYRRWPTRAHLLAAVAEAALAPPTVPRTDDLAADVAAALRALSQALTGASRTGVLADLVAAATHHTELRPTLHRLGEVRRATTRDRLAGAVADGTLPSSADLDMVLDQLLGPLYLHALVTGDELTDHYVGRLVDSVLAGAGFAAKGRAAPGPTGTGSPRDASTTTHPGTPVAPRRSA
jgi:AcrR family transcriptional regulator